MFIVNFISYVNKKSSSTVCSTFMNHLVTLEFKHVIMVTVSQELPPPTVPVSRGRGREYHHVLK